MKKVMAALVFGMTFMLGNADASAGNATKVAEICGKVYKYNLGGSAWRAKNLGYTYERALELTGAAEDEVQLKILKAVWNSEIIDSEESANNIGWGACLDHYEHYLSY